jgi:hypothetical protein
MEYALLEVFIINSEILCIEENPILHMEISKGDIIQVGGSCEQVFGGLLVVYPK